MPLKGLWLLAPRRREHVRGVRVNFLFVLALCVPLLSFPVCDCLRSWRVDYAPLLALCPVPCRCFSFAISFAVRVDVFVCTPGILPAVLPDDGCDRFLPCSLSKSARLPTSSIDLVHSGQTLVTRPQSGQDHLPREYLCFIQCATSWVTSYLHASR
jgi:hypothetical protein